MSFKPLRESFLCGCVGLLVMHAGLAAPGPSVRVKDVTRISGVESYTLIGYGLVVGLAGTGDSDEELTQRTIANLLNNFQIVVEQDNIKADNTAAVMVTATLDSAAHEGDMVKASVSSIGDASSLLGGELLLTPLLGPDGNAWATGQGAVITGGFSFGSRGSGGENKAKNHPTSGILSNGVKLMKDVGLDMAGRDSVCLCLSKPDFTSAANLAEAVNSHFQGSALAIDAATVKVLIPRGYYEEGRVSEFIRELEQVEFSPDNSARVVFNERTGTIVFGGNVQISSVAISHGNLSITVKNTENVSQPGPFSRKGTTVKTTDQQTEVVEETTPVHLIPEVTTVQDLVSILNGLGVTSRDIMVIMHALREAGALHAELRSL